MTKKMIFILLTYLALIPTQAAEKTEADDRPLVYVIPVKDTIKPALVRMVRRGIDEAKQNNVDAIILQMDTTGGRIDSALKIISAIQRSEIPVYTFVEGEAVSSGALIALSTPKIYMCPGTIIGDITPISIGLMGAENNLSEEEQEKMISYVSAHIRSSADQGGYDPDLGEAMVRDDLEYKVGDRVIAPKGNVLLMTNAEAEQLVGDEQQPLLSQGTVNSLDEMLEQIDGLAGAEKKYLEVSATVQSKKATVYVIPVKKTIEPALVYVIRRGIDEATRNNVDAIVFEMDTTGGRVDSALEILALMQRSEIPIYTYVEHQAISAGALIALATPKIYMHPSSVIGDITPISLGLMGGVNELPEAEKEKMTSYVAAHVRSSAEQGGYDPELAEAMVRANLEYKIGEKVIIPEGEVLTMTNTEAELLIGEEQKPLLSQGTVDSLDEMLEQIDGLAGAEKIYLRVSAAEKLARLISALAPILLIIGIGGIWLEIKTPGFGIFGITAIISLALFFLGHHIAGLAGFEDMLLFVAGVILLILEVFVTPGFGVLGISGILLMIVSLLSAMSEHLPGKWRPVSFSPETFAGPLLKVTLAFVGSIALIVLTAKFLPKTSLFKNIALGAVSPSLEKHLELVGLEGVAHSDLRPGGSAYFGDRKMDVVTRGDYIPSQTKVRIVEAHGNRIVVESIS
ncbi:MAG: ATP-dependent Clp protease proteolytic subunit [Pontiellaceae bacterium]|nr:ATP-dependent Clp protease proteolytic subunit [Pontiellaceae bacterium]